MRWPIVCGAASEKAVLVKFAPEAVPAAMSVTVTLSGEVRVTVSFESSG